MDSQRPLSLQDVSYPTQVATSHGFKPGMVVYEKAVGPQVALFIIGSVGEPVSLEKRVLLPHEIPLKIQIPVEKFLQEWSVFRGTLPSAISSEVQENEHQPTTHHPPPTTHLPVAMGEHMGTSGMRS